MFWKEYTFQKFFQMCFPTSCVYCEFSQLQFWIQNWYYKVYFLDLSDIQWWIDRNFCNKFISLFFNFRVMAADTSEGVLTATEIRRFLLQQCSTPEDVSDPSESPEAVAGKTKTVYTEFWNYIVFDWISLCVFIV